jgi:putative transposase
MFIETNHKKFSVRHQCELFGLNRSTIYYEPRPEIITPGDFALMNLVDEIYTKYPFFGTRKMSSYISLHHHFVTRRKIRSIYEKLGLHSVAPGPHTSKPHPENKIYPYLLRDFKITHPWQVLSSDITYLRLEKGFAYLVAIIDWYSRFVLDWQLSISLDADFCIETLARVLKTGHCEIFNVDQGSQFTCHGFVSLLQAANVKVSMDGKGRALDNVFVERLWRSVKYECTYLRNWETLSELRKALQEYFEFYNYDRPHQGLDGLTPAMVHEGKKMSSSRILH